MAQIIVRNLDPAIKTALQERAMLRGTSMEAEAREILQRALSRSRPASSGLGSAIRARFARVRDTVDLQVLPPPKVRAPRLPD